LLALHAVNIRFTSSLTDTDENMIAPAILNAVVSLLEKLPIGYVIRIDTSDSNVYQHSRPLTEASPSHEHESEIHGRASAALG
jgi:hypothetical protein